MEQTIKNIITEVLKLDDEQSAKVDVNTNLIELGLNSLSSVEIVVNLEEQFDIMIDDDDLLVENMLSVELLMELVNKYKKG